MIADINKYKKMDKELAALHQKHNELERNFDGKIAEIAKERDELQSQCEQLKGRVQQFEQLEVKYDQLVQNPANHIEQELSQLKSENDRFRQSNWKKMEEVNKLSNDGSQKHRKPSAS